MIAKLPLVPFVIINLMRLTAGACMRVRFKFKVTRDFSLLSSSRLIFAAQEKPLGPEARFSKVPITLISDPKSHLRNWLPLVFMSWS